MNKIVTKYTFFGVSLNVYYLGIYKFNLKYFLNTQYFATLHPPHLRNKTSQIHAKQQITLLVIQKYTEVKYPHKNDRFETNFWKHCNKI